MSNPNISEFCIGPNCTIKDVINCIDRSKKISIALIVDEQGCLLNTITDGDIRRGLLTGIGLDAPISDLFTIKEKTPHVKPFTARIGTNPAILLKQMQEQGVRQIPLLDADNRVVDIVILGDLLPGKPLPLQALVMAGGLGKRLRPLTEDVPKPMLMVGGRPILEIIIEQLYRAGIRQVYISTNYRAEMIVDHFADGSEYGVSISYVHEDRPLGTAGALGLMTPIDETLLVINGDILTQVNFQAMLAFHQDHNAYMTVATRQYDFQVPYGVIECKEEKVCSLKEKPLYSFSVNAGIYLLEPSVFSIIPKGERFDITELIGQLILQKHSVVSFPIMEYWLDIGQHTDYQAAQDDAKNGKYKLSSL